MLIQNLTMGVLMDTEPAVEKKDVPKTAVTEKNHNPFAAYNEGLRKNMRDKITPPKRLGEPNADGKS